MNGDKNHLESQDDNEDELDLGSMLGDLFMGGIAAFGAYQIGKWLLKDGNHSINQESAELFNLANHHLQQSQFQEAENYARQCLNLNPNNPDVNNLLAIILYYKNAKIDEALSLCYKAIQYAPNEYAKGHYLGTQSDLFFLQGNWQKTIETGEEHLEILRRHQHTPYPPGLWSILRLAISYANISEYKQAIKLYEQAINIEPLNPQQYSIYSGMAYVRGELEQYHTAIKDYEMAIHLMKQSSFLTKEMKGLEISNSLNGLGVIYKKMGEGEKSKEYYSKAIEQCSKNPYPFVNLAGFFVEREDLDNLRYFVEQAVKAIDINFTPHHDLISHLINDKDFQKSEECYQIILSILKSNHLINDQTYRLKSAMKIGKQELFISKSMKDKLKNLIGKNELQPVIENLLSITKKNDKYYNEVILYLNRLTKVETEVRIGIITNEEEDTFKTRIKASLLDLIDRMK